MKLKRELVGESSPSLKELKNHLRLTVCVFDADLREKLYAAIYAAEHFIGQPIALSEFTMEDAFSPIVVLPHQPLIDEPFGLVVKVDGVECSDFEIEDNRITFGANITGHRVTVVFFAGREYTEHDIKAAILLHAAALFNNPVDSVETLPKASTNLLRPYRTWGVR